MHGLLDPLSLYYLQLSTIQVKSNPYYPILALVLLKVAQKNMTVLEVLTSNSWPNRPLALPVIEPYKCSWVYSGLFLCHLAEGLFHTFSSLLYPSASLPLFSFLVVLMPPIEPGKWKQSEELPRTSNHHVYPPLSISTNLFLPATELSPACACLCVLDPTYSWLHTVAGAIVPSLSTWSTISFCWVIAISI